MKGLRHISSRTLPSFRPLVFLLAGIGFGAVVLALQQPRLMGDPEVKIALGEKLFFDPVLSLDSSISCASCHQPDHAFADTVALSKGVNGLLGTRNTPSVMNMAFRPYFFYDGRAASLEHQVSGPIENPVEMNLPYAEAVARVSSSPEYQQMFLDAYDAKPDSILLLSAIADFVRSLESQGNAPHDLWLNDIDDDALNASQLRGRDLFLEKGKCFDCHFGPDFTGDEFRSIGLYDGEKYTDKGRFDISKDSSDLGKFKVPGLRNIEFTAPYMHDGSFETLEEVIEYYDDPYQFVSQPINMDTLMLEPLHLSVEEKADLLAFLISLSDPRIPYSTESE